MCEIVIQIRNFILHDPQILNGSKTTKLVKNSNFLEVIVSNLYEVLVFLFWQAVALDDVSNKVIFQLLKITDFMELQEAELHKSAAELNITARLT